MSTSQLIACEATHLWQQDREAEELQTWLHDQKTIPSTSAKGLPEQSITTELQPMYQRFLYHVFEGPLVSENVQYDAHVSIIADDD